MTLPPCLSSSSSRHYSKYSSVFRHTPKSKQKRPLENSVLAMMPQTQTISRIRSATPEEEPEAASSRNQSKNNEAENEDNAALMLLQLSKIVTKEICSDSGCMAKPKEEEEEEESPATSPVPNNIDIAIQFKIEQTSNHRSTIPECSSSSSLSSSESMESEEDSNHDEDLQNELQNEPSPPICFSSPARRQMPRSASIESLASNNNQHQHPMVAQHQPNRYRTVSLAGDDMYPVCNNERDLSPVLLPLDSPCRAAAKAREHLSSLGIHVTTPSPPRRNSLPRPRFHHHPLFQQELNLLEQQQIFLHQQQQQQQEQHQIMQQQEHEKREAFRMALRGVVNAASNAAASIVTPIPQEPRHVSSSSFAGVDGLVHRSEESSSSSKGSHAPLELPPMLLRNTNAQPATVVSIENNIQPISRLHQPQKKVAAAAAAASVLPKKKQTASNKKHAKPQRTGGKKFSWKNYPELEEFLIQNREEYLCFSAKNYTIEQRDYNNRLTARLLDHANNNGYSSLFETSAFSVVRDRIRSYYKSYVQSFKRRKERQLQQQIRQRAAATATASN
jgi:hypothetical protein